MKVDNNNNKHPEKKRKKKTEKESRKIGHSERSIHANELNSQKMFTRIGQAPFDFMVYNLHSISPT